MKNNSALDDHIKKQFSNYKPDVPAHIWENIVAAKGKRRPGGFWFSFINKNRLFLLLGILLVGGSFLAYKHLYTGTEATLPASNNELKTKDKTIDPVVPAAEKNFNSLNPAGETVKNNPPEKTLASIVTSQKKDPTVFDNIQTGFPTDLQKTNGTAQNANGLLKRSKHTKGKTSMNFQKPPETADDSEMENSAAAFTLTANDLLLKRLLLNISPIQAEKNKGTSIQKINIPFINIPCPQTEKHAAGNKKYIELYAGPDYAFRSLSDTANSVYLQKRKESSQFSFAFSAGIRYTRVFNNGMSFRTGINYSQINEKFKYAQGNIIQVVYITNSNGDTTGSFTTSGTRYKTTYNKFRTIDLPLVIGYELGNGRLHANFNAGAVINIYSWQKGDVLDTAYQPVNITTGKGSSPYQFKTNAGIGFIGAVSVYYKLTNRLHFLAEPYFRYNFSPASKSELTLKQKYNTAGLRLGLRFDF